MPSPARNSVAGGHNSAMLIDTHCHLTSAGLIERIDEVMANAEAAGVTRLLLVAVNVADACAALELMAVWPQLSLITGIHPHEAGKVSEQDFAEILAILRGEGVESPLAERIVGVGETGLDFYYDFAPPERQEQVFRAHLDAARELNLPVTIHARESELRVCEILAEYPALAGRVVFHCFSGPPPVAERALNLGCYLSYTGVVTFSKKAEHIQASARMTPLDRIMVETDAPYLSPEPVRKMRPNEPANVLHTARFLADLRGEDFDTFAAATTANAERFFSLTKD